MPERIQLSRRKGWRKPENTVVVARPSKWGNPYALGETQIRIPGIDGAEWEREGRLHKTSGQMHAFVHPGEIVTWHRVEDATREQVVQMFRRMLDAGRYWTHNGPTLDDIRDELAGKNLACWCPLAQPCHADVLLELANPAPGTPLTRGDEQ